MNDFHFIRPHYLYLFIPFLLALLLLWKKKRRHSIWEQICSEDLKPYVLVGQSIGNRFLNLLFLTIGSLMIVALAGPTWEKTTLPLVQSQSGLVIALDLSVSMNAEDVKPSRLKRAIFKINDLLDIRKEGQTALIAFAAEPFVVTPSTDDVATIKNLLQVLDTSIMPAPGHNVSKAVEKASQLLLQAGISEGSILLITSELSKSDLEKCLELAAKQKVSISVLGVGTEIGSPILGPTGGFLKNEQGAMIVSKLSEGALKQLAESSGGKYVSLTIDDKDVNHLSSHFEPSSVDSHNESEAQTEQWHDEGYWFVLMALPFLLPLFRKGYWMLLMLFLPYGLQAGLWQTPDQKAYKMFHEEDFKGAKDLFEQPDWQAASCYRLEDYEEAAELFKGNQSPDGYYNYGTSKAKLGQWDEALSAYEKVLEIEPEHEDALYNKKLIEEKLKQQKQQDNNKNKNQKSKDKQKQDSDSEDSDNDKQDTDSEGNENEVQDEKQSDEDKKNEDNGEKTEQQDDLKSTDEPEPSKDLEQEYRDKMEKELQKGEESEEKKEIAQLEETDIDPQQEIDEKWLERVPDDPGALLRRKFLHQYRQMQK